jgi:hypothetical protein
MKLFLMWEEVMSIASSISLTSEEDAPSEPGSCSAK